MSYMRTWLSSNGAQQKCDRSKRQRRAGALGRTWGGTVHLVDYATTRVKKGGRNLFIGVYTILGPLS